MQRPLYESLQDLSNKYFIGTVTKTDDPKSKSRVQVTVDGVTDSLTEDTLPWYAIMSVAGGNNNSSVAIPSKNSRVLVSFVEGDIYNGIVAFVLPQDLAS